MLYSWYEELCFGWWNCQNGGEECLKRSYQIVATMGSWNLLEMVWNNHMKNRKDKTNTSD